MNITSIKSFLEYGEGKACPKPKDCLLMVVVHFAVCLAFTMSIQFTTPIKVFYIFETVLLLVELIFYFLKIHHKSLSLGQIYLYSGIYGINIVICLLGFVVILLNTYKKMTFLYILIEAVCSLFTVLLMISVINSNLRKGVYEKSENFKNTKAWMSIIMPGALTGVMFSRMLRDILPQNTMKCICGVLGLFITLLFLAIYTGYIIKYYYYKLLQRHS